MKTSGYVPGSTRMGWKFIGEWTEEEMSPLKERITMYVGWFLHAVGYDIPLTFTFGKYAVTPQWSRYTIQCSTWAYNLHRDHVEDLLPEIDRMFGSV